MLEELRLFDTKVVIEKIEELAFHQIGLGLAE